MKKSINKILVFTLVISLLLPMFIFVGEVKAEEDTGPVGKEWLTITGGIRNNVSSRGLNLYMVSAHDKNSLLIYEGELTKSNSSYGGYHYWEYLAEISLSSGGTYNINDDGSETGFSAAGGIMRWNIEGSFQKGVIPYNPLNYPGLTAYNGSAAKQRYFIIKNDSHVSKDAFLKKNFSTYTSSGGSWNTLYVYNTQNSEDLIYNVRDDDGNLRIYLSQYNATRKEILKASSSIWVSSSLISKYGSENIYIYERYTDTNNKYISRIKNDGTNKERLLNVGDLAPILIDITKDEKYLFYITDTRDDKGLYRLNLLNKTEIMLVEGISSTVDIIFISDNYIYYAKDNKTYRQNIEYPGVNEKVLNFIPAKNSELYSNLWAYRSSFNQFYTPDDDVFYYMHPDIPNTIYKYSLNEPPVLTLSDPKNSTESSNFYSREGPTTIQVKGTITDLNNDTVTVSASIGGVTKTVSVENTKIAKNYTIEFNVVNDNIPDGSHQLKVIAIDQKGAKSNEISRNIIVKARVKHNAFVLVDSPLIYSTEYTDDENDPKLLGSDEYRYIHDPNYFKNSIGLLTDNNTWRNGLYNKLSLPGHYKITYRAKDNPKDNAAFEEFRMQSDESLSEINLYVHRKPIAVFQATMNTSGKITINSDKSYDLDHLGETNNGIISREWRWKEVNSPTWTMGSSPPNSLPAGKEYVIGLRVRDKDGIGGIGVWGDWTDITLGTESGNPAPLNALYTLSPNSVSHKISETITVTNMSSGPITRYEWTIKKAGVQQGSLITTNVPTSAQLKAFGIGKYSLSLRVGDATRWSFPYELPYEVINHPPEASFEAPDLVYRDTNIILNNTTPADLDGDTINYQWKLKDPNDTEYNISISKNPTFNIQSFIDSNNIKPISAISNRWEIKLIATDSLGASSTFSRDLEVINHKPTTTIVGSGEVGQYTSHTYTSGGTDEDTADKASLVYRWSHVKPSGEIVDLVDGETVDIYFDEFGIHKIEHWVVDQIGDVSSKVIKEVKVTENKPPAMEIIDISDRRALPTAISTDPISVRWIYTDNENDPQEKYILDFYYYDIDISEDVKEDEYIGSIEGDDIQHNTLSGDIYEYLIDRDTFEKFRPVKMKGKTYSNNNWSDFSNDVYFIINNPPIGDLSLNKTRFVRKEMIKVTGWGSDADISKGDDMSFEYYYKKKDAAEWEELFNIHTSDLNPNNDHRHSFEFSIDSLMVDKKEEVYEIKQIITDSLGIGLEKIKEFVVENRKAVVEIIEPSSSDKNNPTGLADVDLKPTVKWDYEDLDGDTQTKYRVYIYQGDTDTIVVDSGEISGAEIEWQSPIALSEETLYSTMVEVYDGHEWSKSQRKYFKVFSLKISGYLLPNPALAGDQILFFIRTEGYADKIEIEVDNEIRAYDKRVEMGYPEISYPLIFSVDKNIKDKEDILKYIVWVSTPDTINKNNVQVRQPYKFIVRAYKGSVTREIELELDIRGSVLELLKPGIKKQGY